MCNDWTERPVEEQEVQPGLFVRVYYDDDPGECPLSWGYGNTERDGVMFLSWERDTVLRDYNPFRGTDPADFALDPDLWWLFPLYRYEHGLVAYRVDPFPCPWDSGQVGYVAVDRGWQPKVEGAREIANGLCETVTDWCNGHVYGFIISSDGRCPGCKGERREILDSCWGIYGADYALEEGVAEARAIIEGEEDLP